MNSSLQPRKLYHINIAITLKSPWLVQGSEPGRYGLDATLLRNHNGQPILPGSLIVGRIQAAWNEMKKMDLSIPADENQKNGNKKCNEWFGGEGTNDNLHARIWINDLVIDTKDAELLQATRIHIDDNTETVKSGHLLLIEQTQAAASTVTFKGQWSVYLEDHEAKALTNNLRAGLLWHSQIGAQRSIGFGELVNAQLTTSAAIPKSYPIQDNTTQKRLVLKMDRPICVATRNRRGNVFESSDIITGGTLKGALARLIKVRYQQTVESRIKEGSKLAAYFNNIRISHAFPGNHELRPSAIPLSLASVGNSIMDLAKIKGPHLIDGKAPAFLHDWKSEWSLVEAGRGWGTTGAHLRVRTKIHEKDRTAEDGKLFAYQCKVPTPDTVWLADIEIPDDISENDRAAVWQELTDLLENGLGPIGKTDAWANVTFSDTLETVWPQGKIEDSDKTVILMLNTPAHLLASSQVNVKQPDLYKHYATLFDEISRSTLAMSHFYASHSMAGGDFLWKRYMENAPMYDKNNPTYHPMILTDAGSVFVLNINPENKEKAKEKIVYWQKYGLNLPEAICKEHGKDWKQNPYIPQNGFGEIAVNIAHGYHAPILTACKSE